ncbi:hypothetical protein KJ665_03000, partial [Patescibacteria group bacterium]|nr:hypothetical protein [Patescibacteria group bacterium]
LFFINIPVTFHAFIISRLKKMSNHFVLARDRGGRLPRIQLCCCTGVRTIMQRQNEYVYMPDLS